MLGGTSGKRLKTVEFYDPKMNRWSNFEVDMIDARSAGQAVGGGGFSRGRRRRQDVFDSLPAVLKFICRVCG